MYFVLVDVGKKIDLLLRAPTMIFVLWQLCWANQNDVPFQYITFAFLLAAVSAQHHSHGHATSSQSIVRHDVSHNQHGYNRVQLQPIAVHAPVAYQHAAPIQHVASIQHVAPIVQHAAPLVHAAPAQYNQHGHEDYYVSIS